MRHLRLEMDAENSALPSRKINYISNIYSNRKQFFHIEIFHNIVVLTVFSIQLNAPL